MRAIVIVFAIINIIFFGACVREINLVEMKVYQMYIDNFKDYLIIDKAGNISFCEDKIGEEFLAKGYKIKFNDCSVNLKFKVSFKKIIKWEREYMFYLEKNNAVQ